MEELYCALCKLVPKFPVVLPCCLKTICKEHKPQTCQFCEQDLSSATLAPNTVLLHYFNSQISVKCERCEAAISTISCHNCRVSLCKECSNFIHCEGIYARHVLSNCSQLMNNVDSVEICPTHKLPLKFFCTKDWLGLCRRCKDSHGSHNPTSIEEVFNGKIAETQIHLETLQKVLNSIQSEKIKCKNTLETLIETFEISKNTIINKFKQLKQAIQWKEEEILREIEVQHTRKKIEIEYFLDPLQKNEDRLTETIKFVSAIKSLNPNSVLTQLKFIENVLSKADEIELTQIPAQKPTSPLKFDLQPIVNQIESISLSDEPLTINTSAVNSMPSSLNSLIRSPHLRMKSSEKSVTPIKSRSNSRDSSTLPQNLDENPLEPRIFKKKLQSATAIQVSWTHPTRPVTGLNYCLEYGVGMKLNNIEQFRQVYKGTAHTCIITDLLPKTSYRFRVAAMLTDTKGDWSEIVTVTTFDSQKIDTNTFAAHANMVSRAQEKFIQFDKPGIILASNAYSFGKYSWEIKIFNNSLYPAEGNLLRIGVCGSKSKVVHGVDVDYQTARGAVKVKVMIDIEGKTLYVVNGGVTDTISVPEGPLIPAVQYKPNKSSTAPVRVSVDFDL